MSVRRCGVNTFLTLRLLDRWADVDETLHVYSMGPKTKVIESGILNFGLCAAQDHSKLSPVGRDDLPDRGAYCVTYW